MCKKFGTSCKVWLRAMEAALRVGDGDGCRKLLERAVAALPKRKHVKALTQVGGEEMLSSRLLLSPP